MFTCDLLFLQPISLYIRELMFLSLMLLTDRWPKIRCCLNYKSVVVNLIISLPK